jgi:predicted nucleotidyltransferase
MPTKNLIDSLLPKARQLILRELYLCFPGSIHLRELARKAGMHTKTIQVELRNLLQVGIICEERSGNQKLYKVNEKCPLFHDLKMIIIKTIGVADEIKKALKPLEKKIHRAYIFGSFAAGTYDSESDIDLIVIGKADLKAVAGAMSDTSHMIGRVINPVTFTLSEYSEGLKDNGFLQSIDRGAKIILIGDENDT